jgi:hypothetical protein
LLTRAGLIAAGFAALHLAGARAYTSFLSGTFHAPVEESRFTIILGVLYVLAHLAVTVLAPMLTLAAAILFAADWAGLRIGRGERGHGSPS